MPVVVPKKLAPAPAKKPEPPPVKPLAAPAITPAEVRALLDKQAADFTRQIEGVTQAFTGALKAALSQPKEKDEAGWDFKVQYLNNGDIDTISATPRKAK